MFNVQVRIYGANNEVVWELSRQHFPNMGQALRFVANLNVAIGVAYHGNGGHFIDQHIWDPELTQEREHNQGGPSACPKP